MCLHISIPQLFVCVRLCVYMLVLRGKMRRGPRDLGCPKASSALFSEAVTGREHHCQAVSGTQSLLVPSVPALSTA